MDVEPIPSVADIAAWMRVPFDALDLAEKLAGDAKAVRDALRGVYTSAPLGVYLHATDKRAAISYDAGGDLHDFHLVKAAVDRVRPAHGFDVLDPRPVDLGQWVKVAYSPFLHAAGEALNFFPGHYGGTQVANHASPVTSMLTSGLVGAGLGYGAGALGETLLPDTWKRGRLRKTLAAAGAGLGVAPGLIWGLANRSVGRGFNDPALTQPGAGGMSNVDLAYPTSTAAQPGGLAYKAALDRVELGQRYKAAVEAYCGGEAASLDGAVKEAFGDSFETDFGPPQGGSNPLSVDVDALGRTLWQSGASPQTAGMTMGAMAAAAQMPGGTGDPGFVTPLQMANLAAHMGAGYLSGALVGTTLGLLTGMPESAQQTLKRTGMYVGVVRSVVPKLFGQD